MPFVGAGLSHDLGLPETAELVRLMAEELGWDPDVFKHEGSFFQLAQYYVCVKGSIGPLRSKLDKAWNPTADDVRRSRVHRALAELRPARIYTTNYDDLIERAFELHDVPCHVITSIDDIASAPLEGTQLVKFHGTFSDDSSLVLTESSYFDRLDFESALDIKLRSDSLGRCILFLGYSLNDIDVRFLLHKLRKLRQLGLRTTRLPSAVLVTTAAGHVQSTLLEFWGVRSIEIEPIDPSEKIADLLESLL
jgi:hypothetical protein